MKYSTKLYDYEIKGSEEENNLINEKINYTTKNYFYIVNNFSKEISRIEDEINIFNQNNPINLNELIYNQHIIIKELVSKINKISKNDTLNYKCDKFDDKYDESIVFENKIENNVISFTIFPSYTKNFKNNNIQFYVPSPVYRKKITLNLNNSSRINTSFSKNDFNNNSLEKKINNSLSTLDNDNSYSLKIQNNKNIKIMSRPVPMVEKIKNENNIKIKKFSNNINTIPSKDSYKSLKYKLKYKCYKPSFLNSFVSGKKKKNRSQLIKAIKSSSDLLSTNRHSFEKKIKNKNNKNISVFNGTYTNINTIESKKSGIKRIKRVKSNTIYNLNIIDDSYANKYLERTNTKSRPKANKYVKNLYVISNEIVDKFHKKISED